MRPSVFPLVACIVLSAGSASAFADEARDVASILEAEGIRQMIDELTRRVLEGSAA